MDGFPVGQVVASDLHPEFWQLGHKLFNSSPQTFPVPFIPGDVFDPTHLAPAPVLYSAPPTVLPALTSLTSLTPLQGHVSAIHASSFFHLFDEVQQEELARLLASLLAPESGSMLFGSHGGLPEKGTRPRRRSEGDESVMFCHSPESWKELWDGVVFERGTARVEVVFRERQGPDGPNVGALIWSVTRV